MTRTFKTPVDDLPRSRRPNHGLRLFAVIALSLLAPSPLAGPALASPTPDLPVTTAASSQASLSIKVTVIHARKGTPPPEPDRALEHLAPQLTRSFRDYGLFTRVTTETLDVGASPTPPMTLPNGTTLVLRHDGTQDGYAQIHLSVGGLRTTVQAKPGAVFFQAGRAFEGGILVLAFEVGR